MKGHIVPCRVEGVQLEQVIGFGPQMNIED